MIVPNPTYRIGLSGWSYKDWEGTVYPRGTRDKLRYAAEHFDVLEINSTFYRPPSPTTALSWLKRTIDLPQFQFTAKLHRDVTHKGHVDPEMTLHYRRAFTPLIEEGKLSHFLAQFSAGFRDAPPQRDLLQRIAEAYGGLTQLTFELRHNSWQSPAALRFMDGLGINLAHLDYPAGRDGFNLTYTKTGQHAYLRLHGRNRAAWYGKDPKSAGRYDYLYPHEELNQIVERAKHLAENSQSLTIVANNHARGNAAANARDIKDLMESTAT